MVEMNADITLDTKGLLCPMPVVKAKLAIGNMAPGQTVKVEATDPGSVADFPAWCRGTGNKLLHTEKDGKVFTFFIEKA